MNSCVGNFIFRVYRNHKWNQVFLEDLTDDEFLEISKNKDNVWFKNICSYLREILKNKCGKEINLLLVNEGSDHVIDYQKECEVLRTEINKIIANS